jgi:hypothetical protein
MVSVPDCRGRYFEEKSMEITARQAALDGLAPSLRCLAEHSTECVKATEPLDER